MKLFYHVGTQDPVTGCRNFGDELNQWLWHKMLPDLLDEDAAVLFVGIGTILDERIPKARRTIVFGAGTGYGKRRPLIDKNWKIYCLRGPMSACALGLPNELAVTDPGALVRRFVDASDFGSKLYKFSYMPHESNAGLVWQSICKRVGFGYINPRSSIETVLCSISRTEVLITEAMHGAIVADALRIPWIAVRSSPRILEFKWRDWSASIQVNYQPFTLPSLRTLTGSASRLARVRHLGKAMMTSGYLRLIAQKARPILSRDDDIDQLTVELETRLDRLRNDLATESI